ncbi:hypothetical protein [Desulforhopalus sp. 52FAK]
MSTSTSIIDTKPLFKTCSMCKTIWDNMDVFLSDPHLSFNGYQPNFGQLEQGIFFFTHNTDECGSTIGLSVRTFAPLYTGPRHTSSKQLSKDCPRYCLDKNNLKRCDAHCENAYAREISQIIKNKMNNPRKTNICVHDLKTVPGVLELR